MFTWTKSAEIFDNTHDRTASATARHGILAVGTVLLLSALLPALAPARAAAVELVSVNINGTAGNRPSSGGAVNADGSVVAFFSDATDLVRGDTNQFRD